MMGLLGIVLLVQLVTGALMVVGEPQRALLSFSFWLKMFLVAAGAIAAAVWQNTLKHNEYQWDQMLAKRRSVKSLAIVALLMWVAVVILGRLIAYDYVWGSWSLNPKA